MPFGRNNDWYTLLYTHRIYYIFYFVNTYSIFYLFLFSINIATSFALPVESLGEIISANASTCSPYESSTTFVKVESSITFFLTNKFTQYLSLPKNHTKQNTAILKHEPFFKEKRVSKS